MENLKEEMHSRTKRGKSPRKVRYDSYCGWAYALLVSNVIFTCKWLKCENCKEIATFLSDTALLFHVNSQQDFLVQP